MQYYLFFEKKIRISFSLTNIAGEGKMCTLTLKKHYTPMYV